MKPTCEPRVYVACLHCYNSGKLHGEWFDADDELESAAAEYFEDPESAEDPENTEDKPKGFPCGGEELLCHDSEGFPCDTKEWGLSEAAEIGQALRDHGPVVGLLMDHLGCDARGAVRYMNDNSQGTYKSKADWAEDRSEQFGDKIPEYIAYHVDWDGVAEAAENGGDVFFLEHDGEVHAFSNG